MNKSESVKNLAIALSKFQAEISNPKNTSTANAGSFKYHYAPLQEVLTLVRPLLSKYGLAVVQLPFTQGESTGVITTLLHESGEFIESDPLVLKAEKNTPQGAGSVITYARRYAISAVLGIASEEDDDGAEASGTTVKSTQPKLVSQTQLESLYKLVGDNKEAAKKVLTKHNYKQAKDMLEKDYNKIVDEIKKEIGGNTDEGKKAS